MRCPVCGAVADKDRSHCVICGRALREGASREWAREPEAAAYEDLRSALEPGEALLGSTRGRLAGSWHERLFLSPQAVLSPYVNVGLTPSRILVQVVNPSTGRANPNSLATVDLQQVSKMTAADADPLEDGRATRLVVGVGGNALRVRAAGRHAASAREMVEVWESLASEDGSAGAGRPACSACSRELDGPYRFCPYCGKELAP